MKRKLTDLQECLDQILSDAMSNAMDVDVGIGELSRAASIALSEALHEVLHDELDRIGKLHGPHGVAKLLIGSTSGGNYSVTVLTYPKGDSRPGSDTIFAANLPEAIAKAEASAEKWCQTHRVMTADDLGIGVAA
jgi:hypothetical protein